jgi:hypothetical protein
VIPTRTESNSLPAKGKHRESSSFLKKRTKKLLSVSGGTGTDYLGPTPRATVKSFLVLFFKKELLPSPLRFNFPGIV